MRAATYHTNRPEVINIFQSTLPMRAATSQVQKAASAKIFQSTLPMRAATGNAVKGFANITISIHAAHAGSDRCAGVFVFSFFRISIHAAHAGSDRYCGQRGGRHEGFQSTLPMRAATAATGTVLTVLLFQSTLPMRAATRLTTRRARLVGVFQSTLPMRAATINNFLCFFGIFISIHAAHAGSDSIKTEYIISSFYLYKSAKRLHFCLKALKPRFFRHIKFMFNSASHYNNKTPSASYEAFAPKCSVLFWYLLPKL